MAAEPPFVVGSAVRLKGGSPSMTVLEIHDKHVVCAWFAHDGAPNRATFPIEAVEDPDRRPLPQRPPQRPLGLDPTGD